MAPDQDQQPRNRRDEKKKNKKGGSEEEEERNTNLIMAAPHQQQQQQHLLPRTVRVKNKAPAPVQITAEQLLREAREHQEQTFRPPTHKITDADELAEYRLRRRKVFEDKIRRPSAGINLWASYANWEESQKDLKRSRSVWERALVVHYKNHTLWVKYAEAEMRNKFINQARNVWDRAVTYLPRVDQLWYTYIHMEERLGNVAGARQLFGRWMAWNPDENAWSSYIRFELRYNQVQRARHVYEQFVKSHPNKAGVWIRFAKFEMKHGDVIRARDVYERATAALTTSTHDDDDDDDDDDVDQLLIAFADFEERCKEIERARAIYKLALEKEKEKGRASRDLRDKFLAFERRCGDRAEIGDAIIEKRRTEYQKEVTANPFHYDGWFDLIGLEESTSSGDTINVDRTREIYERAIANVPPAAEKLYWKQYIWLWISYAVFEEYNAGDVGRARDVYRECLNLIPHDKFSFAKIWILASKFEIRQDNLKAARLILGSAIGKAANDKIFKHYIGMELKLHSLDGCRTLCEKYLLWAPANASAWCYCAEFESCLRETERARAIFELGTAQPVLYNPELLWKSYIHFEISEGEVERARALYERLLDRTKHLNVWISYAQFEVSEQCIERARKVFERAYTYFKTSAPELKKERNNLLQEWLQAEKCGFGDLGKSSLVESKLPKKLKRKRPTANYQDGTGMEEYIDYLFPDDADETQSNTFRILEAAYRWKRQKEDR